MTRRYNISLFSVFSLFSVGVKAVSTLLFTHKNGDLGAISATEQSFASPISKVESHISDRCLSEY